MAKATPVKPTPAIQQLVRSSRGILHGANSAQTLVQRHKIGDLINRLRPFPRGDDQFAAISTHFALSGLTGFGISNLRKFAKFAQRFTVAEAKSLDLNGVSWRDADRLRSVHIKAMFSQRLVNRALRKQRSPGYYGQLVSEVSEPDARENLRSTVTAAKRADRAIKFLATVAMRIQADKHARGDAHAQLLYLSRKSAKLLQRIKRLPTAHQPPSQKRARTP